MSSFRERLDLLQADGRLRKEVVQADSWLDVSSNDYLGLSRHSEVKEGAIRAVEAWGCGSTGSRLVTGTTPLHLEFEEEAARFLGTEAVCLFPSGYQANVGLLSAIVEPGDELASDALNHASIIDGCRLSRARVRVFPHNQPARIEASAAGHLYIVTDGVFSMGGDLADVSALTERANVLGASLVVDEAHALGVCGPGGRGVCAASGIRPTAITAGLGKALGSGGGLVAGTKDLVEYLRNRARSYVFTTGASPANTGAALSALRLLQTAEGEDLRGQLSERVAWFAERLRARGWLEPGAGRSPIFPIVVGDDRRAVALSESLQQEGVLCRAIRPPTVPEGSAMLRVAMKADHPFERLERLLALLDRFCAADPSA